MKFSSIVLTHYLIPLFLFVTKAVFIITGIILALSLLYFVGKVCVIVGHESWKIIRENFSEAPLMTVVVVSFLMFVGSSLIVLGSGGFGALSPLL